MRRLKFLAAAVVLLAGCSSSSKVPMITFEAKPFLKAYMADRDEVVRTTAPAVKRCRSVTSASPEDLRVRCELVKQSQADWARRDEVVYEALMTGKPVSTVDWEKVSDVAGKFIGAAAGVAL